MTRKKTKSAVKIIDRRKLKAYKTVTNYCHNLLCGNYRINPDNYRRLKTYKKMIRKLASPRVGIKTKKKILKQKGGGIGALLAMAIPAITTAISSLMSK